MRSTDVLDHVGGSETHGCKRDQHRQSWLPENTPPEAIGTHSSMVSGPV